MADTQPLLGMGALVTGGGLRLGREFAVTLAQAGADVVVHFHRSEGPAEKTARLVREAGQEAATLRADLSNLEETAGLFSRATDSLGAIQLLVNNASVFESVGAAETTPDIWQRNMDVNLRAPVMLIQRLAANLEGESGAAVNLLDWRALRPGPDHFAYTIAKAGLAAATRSLAQAYAPNMRVNGLALGAILPPAGAGPEEEEDIIEPVPAGRWGSPEEAAEALLFLMAGPKYITGEILHLDGGRQLV